MQLHERQERFVEAALKALSTSGSGLGIAPTGSGKTVCLAAAVDRALSSGLATRVLWLQHRMELLSQNSRTFWRWSRGRWGVGIWGGGVSKSVSTARVVFGMVQTAALAGHGHPAMSGVDLIVVDEAHHAPAMTYRKILDAVESRGATAKRLGVTATPSRADGIGYEGIFGEIFDQITMEEMIAFERIVPARFFVLSLGKDNDAKMLSAARADIDDVARAVDREDVSRRIVAQWAERAAGRKTVAFCCNIEHAKHLASAFSNAGYKAECVSSRDAPSARLSKLEAFDNGELDVLTNASLLTEGWDCQAVQCVILCRPCNSFSSMVQMVGRGLRALDPERYPWSPPKQDCIVLDFGGGVRRWGGINALYGHEVISGEADRTRAVHTCPECGFLLKRPLLPGKACPECGFVKPSPPPQVQKNPLVPDEWTLEEMDLGARDNWAWMRIGEKHIWVATAPGGWGMVAYTKDGDAVHAAGSENGTVLSGRVEVTKVWEQVSRNMKKLGISTNRDTLALRMPPTEKQISLLRKVMKQENFSLKSKYDASCAITFVINKRRLEDAYRHS